MKHISLRIGLLFALAFGSVARSEYPVQRPPGKTPPPAEAQYTVHPERPRQVIRGLGFEIQCDSIASGNAGLPEVPSSVPHDLAPAERVRFYNSMLKGFRYCRLAGGLYWRGLDQDRKQFQGRWPEQMAELREMIQAAGLEGIALEYWSPAPYWKANGRLEGKRGECRLRCFGKDFAHDPDYHGDKRRFLDDFAEACRRDLLYLRGQGIPVVYWGLQNEPPVDETYSSCRYTHEEYAETFRAVAPRIRAFAPQVRIMADAWDLAYIAPVLKDPAGAALVDALVIHHIGCDSKEVRPRAQTGLAASFPDKPLFQNEYEYLNGPASPARCLNTVQHLMNWFQLTEAPTWFWIHALKPIQNSEASGYALGFWTPPGTTSTNAAPPHAPAPGHWTWNPYNWYAVGSFIRHMPWDCRAVAVEEASRQDDLRLLAFTRPDGKLTVALSNRSGAPHTFHLDTGRPGASFLGFRYTPEEAGADFRGVVIGALAGRSIHPRLGDLTWEFWEEQ